MKKARRDGAIYFALLAKASREGKPAPDFSAVAKLLATIRRLERNHDKPAADKLRKLYGVT